METGENNPITIQAKSFSSSLTEHCHLAIELGINRFSYSIVDTKSLTYQYFKSHTIVSTSITNAAKEITTLINADDLIKTNFLSQSVAFINCPSTLVPSTIYNPKNNKELLELNTKVFPTINVDKIKAQDLHLIYTLPEEIYNIANDYFPKAKLYSQESVAIEQYSKLNNKNEKAYLYISDKRLNISIFKNGKLVFNNSFEYTAKEDILYFTLFSFEQLKLSTENIVVVLFGAIEENSDLYTLLYDYIRNIELGERTSELNFPPAFNNLPKQKYFNLFTQFLCV